MSVCLVVLLSAGTWGWSPAELQQKAPSGWTYHADPLTGRVALAIGSGIPLPAGEAAARAFVEEHRELIAPTRGELVLDTAASQTRDGGRLASFYWNWHVDGVPVEGASVFVRSNSGRVTQFGSRFVGDIDVSPSPAIDAATARATVLRHGGETEGARFAGEPTLLLQPEESGNGLSYRLIWRVVYRVAGRPETWEGRVDAATGRVVAFDDVNLYSRAVGGVHPRSVWFPGERRVPMPALAVDAGGVRTFTDDAGRFAYSGGHAQATLTGRHIEIVCEDCREPEQPLVTASIGTGRLDFGVTGWDEVGNGRSTRAARNVYYHANQVRRLAAKWLPEMRWLRRERVVANVDLPLACNAFYSLLDGSINFYRSGNGCNNTGAIADVIYHEWGHAIDVATLLMDHATSEGTADVASMLMTHSPLIAPGFRQDGRPIRNLDAATDPGGSMTLSRVLAGDCVLPDGRQSVHCIGTVYGQAAWELARALGQRHGIATGWRIAERLFFHSLADAGSLYPESPHAIYAAYLQADDDDGDLANGTPHAAEIHAAFARHGIAQAPLPATPSCAPPPQPTLAVTPRCDAVEIGWEPVEGASHYEVSRAELGTGGPLFPVALLGPLSTSYRDEEVDPGLDYAWVVMAVDGQGCESTVEGAVAGRLPMRSLLTVVGSAGDDVPRGNRSGYPDPGEEIELRVTLANEGSVDAVGLSGRLEPLGPGVAMLEERSSWPTIPPGGTAASDTPFVMRIDESVPCGADLGFRFVPDDLGGCAGEEVSFLSLRVGEPDERFGFVCDPTPACFTPPEFTGLLQASPGASCAEVLLRWAPARSHCADATIAYDIYRGAEPDFPLDPAHRVATGVVATAWTDRLLVPDRVYHYAVRAIDSRSGSEANGRVVAVTASSGVDFAGPEFAGSVVATAGTACGETRLQWEAARETCSLPVAYAIHRSTEPDFAPSPENLVATTLSAGYVDAGLEPGRDHHYRVLALDDAGNPSALTPGASARAGVSDRVAGATTFEFGGGGWRVVAPNEAIRGNWEWGDPEGDELQPEDDATPDGRHCWATGIARFTADGSNNDVDFGTTTLLSARYDLTGAADPVVRYSRWFTNDRSTNPGDPRDSLRVHVSNDDGRNWTLIEEIGAGTPLAWVGVELPLGGIVEPTASMRLRFTAADVGQNLEDGSKVEAAVDDFSIVDRDGGCAVCSAPVAPVGRLTAERSGLDVVLDWSDATPGTRFAVYALEGSQLELATRVGTTTDRRFIHTGAVAAGRSFAYLVSAFDACGRESPLR